MTNIAIVGASGFTGLELTKILEKHQQQLDENIHTKVLLTEATKKIEKLQQDVEKLVRKNGK